MKKITLISLFVAISAMMTNYAAEILVGEGQSLKTAIRGAQSGDVIVLTSATVYPIDSTRYVQSLTIMADPSLSAKPTIKLTPLKGEQFPAMFYPAGGATITFERIVFDGSKNAGFLIYTQYEGLANLTFKGCDFIDVSGSASSVAFVTKKYTGAPTNFTTVAGSLTVQDCSFIGGGSQLLSMTSASFASVDFNNCLVKGAYSSDIITNTTSKPDVYSFNHMTFDGCNWREFSISSNSSITFMNTILANNTYTAKPLILSTGLLTDHCGVFNHLPGHTSYINANTLTLDPLFDANGIATAPEYVNAGNDAKTIGYFDNGQLSAIKTIYADRLAVAQDKGAIRVKGVSENASYALYSVSGKNIAKGIVGNGIISTTGISKGVYFLKVGSQVAKFVVR